MAKKAAKKAAPKKAAKKVATKKSVGDPMEIFEQIKTQIPVIEEELRKFIDEEVKASARRARVAAQDVRKGAGALRKAIMEVVKSRKG